MSADPNKEKKKNAQPLFLRPYSAASGGTAAPTVKPRGAGGRAAPRLDVTTSILSSDNNRGPARVFRPKAPDQGSPENRAIELKKKKVDDKEEKSDEDMFYDAMDVFERIEQRGTHEETVAPVGPRPSFAQRQRIMFNPHSFAQNRLKQNRGQGTSKPLQDVSYVQDGKYRPITVPFFLPDSETAKKEREKKPSEMFYKEGEGWLEERLTMIQMPIVLPTPFERRDEAIAQNTIGGIHSIPDGKIGKLRVYKSGKVKMEIGGIEFDVLKGCDVKCHQEVCCISDDQNVVMFMGPAPTKAVVIPDLKHVLSMDKTDATAVGAE